ncbi:MAG: hypothetical protein E7680_01905 [Ruminococcaceae bacterium]|nr:hypothetical protein [Oscillospiraceae bacterium]
MGYGFFDYKYHIPDEYKTGMFTTAHIGMIVLVYLLAIFLPILLRNVQRRKITIFLRVLSIAMVVLEVTKITWESYFDITTGQGFNFGGILPLYTCSLFIYTLLFAAWTKGRVQKVALSFITTIGLLFGAIGVVYCNGLNWYPLFSFGGLYSFLFHSTMFVTGMLLLITQYHEPEWKDSLWIMIPVLLLSVFAIPANYRWSADYMLLYSGSGVPIYEEIAAAAAEKGLRFLYTLLMLITHIPLACLVIGVAKFVKWSAKKIKKKPSGD